MYRLIGTCRWRTLQSRFSAAKVRSSFKVVMEGKEDVTQPIGKQPSQEESRQFTTVANVEGQVGE